MSLKDCRVPCTFVWDRSRAEEEVSTLRRTVSADCNMQADWINYVVGVAYPELEEFLGWVQASYLDNLSDPGLRRLARVANLRTDAFLASLRDHKKPKSFTAKQVQPAQMPISGIAPVEAGASTSATTLGTTTRATTTFNASGEDYNTNLEATDVVDANAPLDITAVLSMVRQGRIGDAVDACVQAQVHGCTTTLAACNFLLSLCLQRELDTSEGAAAAVYTHLEQAGGQEPDMDTYSHFIQILCQTKNVARAIAVLTQMQTRGHVPRGEDFASVINVCVGLADVSKGMQVATQAIEAGSMPSLELLNALLSASRTSEETTAVFQAISTAGHEPDKRSYQQLVEASCVCCDSSLIVRALRQMAKRRMAPTEALLTRAVERCATANVHHSLKILQMCAAGSLPLPATEGVLFFLQMCCENSSGLSASTVQDCLTAMHSNGFTIDASVKEAFRTLRVRTSTCAAL